MKKYRSVEQSNIIKQKIKLVSLNILAFFFVFIILGLIAITLINKVFFKNIKNELSRFSNEIRVNLSENIKNDYVNYTLPEHISVNARVYIFIYKEDLNVEPAISENVLAFFMDDYFEYDRGFFGPNDVENIYDYNQLIEEYKLKRSDALKHELFQLNIKKLDDYNFENVISNGFSYNFLTYSFELDKNLNTNISEAKYVKLLIMTNGEVISRNSIIKIYIYCAFSMFFLGILASFVLAIKAIRPLIISLENQKKFVSDASHELRTPLAIVQSNLENILTRSSATVYDVSEDIASSLKEVTRLNILTKELLTLAKSDNDQVEYAYEDVDIYDLIKNSAQPFFDLALIQEKEFNINGQYINARVDKAKITQLTIILLDNAFKYTNKGDEITINITSTNNEIIISCIDTGIGISDYTKTHIFERFYREDEARNRKNGGNGLGLAIAKTIVNTHKGKIVVNHNYPKGTVFTVTIPKK